MSYSPPVLTVPVVLAGPYSPPSLSTPVVLCGVSAITGALLIDLPVPSLPLVPDIHGLADTVGRLAVDLPVPALPLVPDIYALTEPVARLAISLPAPVPALTLTATARVYDLYTYAALRISLPLPALDLIPVIHPNIDLALPDADGAVLRDVSGQQEGQRLGEALPAQDMLRLRRPDQIHQQDQIPLRAPDILSQTDMIRFRHNVLQAKDQQAIRKCARRSATATDMIRFRTRTDSRETHGLKCNHRTNTWHQEAIRFRHNVLHAKEQQALRRITSANTHHQEAIRVRTPFWMPHTDMKWPEPGIWWPPYVPPPLQIRFCCPGEDPSPSLARPVILKPRWGMWPYWYQLWPYCPPSPPWTPGGLIIVPARRVYYVLNTVTLEKLDETPIPLDRLSLSLDADSWTWSWSANVPGSSLALVQDKPELLARVNGAPIRLVVDSISRSRSFGSNWLTVSGRGRAAVLGAPTAASVSRRNVAERTAQQLLDDALTENGVPIGWDLDWQIEDWLVPAGAWSHTGTYIEAALRIAEAGGGYIQGHDTARTLLVLPYYPAAPWDWMSTDPDIQLPEDACVTEGIEWIEKAGYNGVWVTGKRRDFIRRAGTDGATLAQTVVDDLATNVIMTRQRGLRVLADTGAQANITLKLPVLEEVGIIHPGKLVRYIENGHPRMGISRAVSVECGFPEVWQTIKLETRA